jgi:hypothetical protein
VTVFFWGRGDMVFACGLDEIDRSLSIVVETAQNPNRAIFPLKSKAEKFDGSMVGVRPSSENFCV